MCFRRFVISAAVVLAAIAPTFAADPAVEVRIKSVDTLLARAEYLGGLVGQGEQAKQVAGVAKAFMNDKGLVGIDPTKDFGFYATVTPDVVDSPMVLMIPIKDADAFLGLLTNQLGLMPKKGDDGAYAIDVPMIPKPIYFRLANGYAYATFGDAKHVAAAGLVVPEKFFGGKNDAVLSATVHVDRIPDEMKKMVFGQIELKMAEEKGKKNPNETPAERMFKELVMDGVVSAIKAGTFEAKSVTLALSVEPKSDDLGLELTVTPKPGTALAKAMAANAARPGVAGRLKADGLSNFTTLKLAVADDALPALAKIADALATQVEADAKPEAKEIAKEAIDAALATFRKGELDFGFASTKPRADGSIGMVAVLKVVKGKDAEAVLRKAAAFAPADEAVFTFDVAKLGGADLHKVEVKGPGAAKLKTMVGSETIWFAVGDDLMVVGSDELAVKAAVAGKAGPVPAVASDTALVAILAVQQKAEPNPGMAKAMRDAFGDRPAAGADTVKVSVETGEALKVKLALKGSVVTFLRLANEAGPPK